MFRSKRGRPALEGPPCLGPDRRVYAIGDIHGRLDLFERLVDKIATDDWQRPQIEDTSLILLGDYVDRGPQSAQVIDFILKLRERWPNINCLMGNHEQIFLMAINGDEAAIKFFTRPGVGGRETLMSYGASEWLLDNTEPKELHNWILDSVPQSHKDFLVGLSEQVIIGDYAFVHAGIAPGVPMEDQEAGDLLWIRDPFLEHEGMHPYMIVHGHSIRENVEKMPNRIGIDTGAYMSGRLTAIGLEGTDQWFLNTGKA